MQTLRRLCGRTSWQMAVTALTLTVAMSARADDIARIFDLAWTPSTDGYRAAEAIYSAAKMQTATDVRLPYSMALVALQNRQYDSAIGYADAALAVRANFPEALRLKAWLQLLKKDRTAALNTLAQLGSAIAAAPAATDDTRYEQLADSLGRMVAFMAKGGETPAETLAALETVFADKLPANRAAAFTAGKQVVGKQFSMQGEQLAQAREEAKRIQEAEKVAQKQKIEKEREQIGEYRDKLQEAGSKAQAEFKSDEAELKSQMEPLKKELDRLEDRAKPLLNRVRDAERDADRKRDQAKREKDDKRAKQLREDAERIERNVRDDRSELNKLQSQIDRVRGDGNRLLGKLRAAQGKLQTIAAGIQRESSQLNQMERQHALLENEIAKPATGDTGGVRAMEARQAALTTFVPLPLDAERERILATLGGK